MTSAHILADTVGGFASSPAGYITGLGLPLLSLALGYLFKDVRASIRELNEHLINQDKTVATQSEALAVIVERIRPMMETSRGFEDRLRQLELSRERLEGAVDSLNRSRSGDTQSRLARDS